jgi:hypothetical protein
MARGGNHGRYAPSAGSYLKPKIKEEPFLLGHFAPILPESIPHQPIKGKKGRQLRDMVEEMDEEMWNM